MFLIFLIHPILFPRSQNKYDGRTSDVYFLSELSIGTKDTPYTSFSVKILTEMDDFKIGIIVNGRSISTNLSDSIRYLLVYASGQWVLLSLY